jgi:hypothetical protein
MGIQHRLRVTVIATLVLVFCGTALARPVNFPDYPEMTAKADLVVLAMPIDQRVLPDKATVPGILRGNDPIPAVEVETTFEIQAVLHGKIDKDKKTLVLLHYRETNPPPKDQPQISPPALIDFKAKSGKLYLMFLHQDADGRYSAFNGQTDPAWSIRDVDPATL